MISTIKITAELLLKQKISYPIKQREAVKKVSMVPVIVMKVQCRHN